LICYFADRERIGKDEFGMDPVLICMLKITRIEVLRSISNLAATTLLMNQLQKHKQGKEHMFHSGWIRISSRL